MSEVCDFLPRFWLCRRCLIDSQLPGSKSQFLPRTRDEKLHVVIDSFRFHNQDGGEVRPDLASLSEGGGGGAVNKFATHLSCSSTSHVTSTLYQPMTQRRHRRRARL